MYRTACLALIGSLLTTLGCATERRGKPEIASESPKAQAKSAAAPERNEAKSILEKSVKALKRTRLVSYDAEFKGTGWIRQYVPQITGKAIVGEQSKWEIDQFRAEVRIQKDGSTEVVEMTAGCDGDLFFLIDPQTKKVFEDMDSLVLGTAGRDIQRVVMRQFAAAEPLKDLDKAESIELAGSAYVGGEACHEIVIKMEQQPEQHIFISKRDFLPRRALNIYPNRQDPEGEPGSTDLTITNLVVNPKISGSPFKLTVPDGYEKVDDFAP